MSLNNFTVKSQEAVQKAVEIASSGSNQAVEPLHLLKGIFVVDENVVPFLFGKLGVNFGSFSGLLDREIDALPKVSGGEPYLSSNSNKVLRKAQELASAAKDEFVSIEQLLLAIFSLDDPASRLLKRNGVNEKDLKSAIGQLRKGSSVNSPTAEETYNALNKFAINLNNCLLYT